MPRCFSAAKLPGSWAMAREVLDSLTHTAGFHLDPRTFDHEPCIVGIEGNCSVEIAQSRSKLFQVFKNKTTAVIDKGFVRRQVYRVIGVRECFLIKAEGSQGGHTIVDIASHGRIRHDEAREIFDSFGKYSELHERIAPSKKKAIGHLSARSTSQGNRAIGNLVVRCLRMNTALYVSVGGFCVRNAIKENDRDQAHRQNSKNPPSHNKTPHSPTREIS